MAKSLTLGYSTCPNDTFIFGGIAQKSIDLADFSFDITLADVEELNRMAMWAELDVSKISAAALPHVLDKYLVLQAGGALGRGCGPMIVAREPLSMEQLRVASLAIPGRWTTAAMLLNMHGGHQGRAVEMRFDKIMPAVLKGSVDAGLIIHEGRFTYASQGLHQVIDLGEWWEKETGAPIPLGCIVARRDLGGEVLAGIDGCIRRSLQQARANPQGVWPYIEKHAQETAPEVIRQHIDTFVNDFSLDLGGEGGRAIRLLVEMAAHRLDKPVPDKPLFRDLS